MPRTTGIRGRHLRHPGDGVHQRQKLGGHGGGHADDAAAFGPDGITRADLPCLVGGCIDGVSVQSTGDELTGPNPRMLSPTVWP